MKILHNINWNNIRPLKNSQKEGFEELVCQLARNEKIEGANFFTRKGTPDAGVECFWTLKDGTEIAWQAKFFTSPLTNTQWSEVDKSVKTMLEKHSDTIKYIVSIPQDRADARVEGQKSFLQKWNDRVVKWKNWAKDKGLKIDFVYEGSSELLDKLSLPVNIGKTYYWFNKEELDDDWFVKQNKGKIDDLGARYSPEVNVDLDIKYVFEGLYKNYEYLQNIRKNLQGVEERFAKYLSFLNAKKYDKLYDETIILHRQYNKAINEIDLADDSSFSKTGAIIDHVTELINSSSNLFRSDIKSGFNEQQIREQDEERQRLMDSLFESLRDFSHLDSKLADSPFLLIEGDAGMGKSHLIADVILDKSKEKQFSILLLGQHFVEGNIWIQILDELGVNLTKDELLGSLNAKAESSNSRIIFYIDAINEGEGKYLWKNRLLGFINDFKTYKYLGLVLSIRTTYKDIVLPDRIYENVENFTHRGFENDTKAVKRFFEYYQINEPPIPILNPEFNKPLFLKLFCKGLHDNGIKNIPNGYEGISTIFEYVISAANKAISIRLEYDFKMMNLVNESVKVLVGEIIGSPSLTILKKDAYNLLTKFFKDDVNQSRNILTELINENIVNENAVYNSATKKYDKEIIYFSYERFGDHLLASTMIDKFKDELINDKKIKQQSLLYELVKDEHSILSNQGLIEALSIQLPEKVNLELYELVPNNKIYDIGEAFLSSLIWRRSDAISDKVLGYINDYVITINGLREGLLETLIQVSIKEGHYFNARFLDGHLFNMKLSDRDAHWTIYINDSEYGIPYTLVEWTRESRVIGKLDIETKKLLSLILSWFLTSSNRELRDNTTKALVNLFQNNLKLLEGLIGHFKNINDIYIIERLYAVGYGATLRTNDSNQVKQFANFIYEITFKNKVPLEHLLLRDYARGTIEYAISKGLISGVNLEEISAPYGSEMPSEYPSDEYIKRYDIEKDKESITQNQLYDYVMGFSDFARYTIGTNGISRISLVTVESAQAYKKLNDSLSKKDKKHLEDIFKIIKNFYDERVTDEYRTHLKKVIDEIKNIVHLIFGISEDEAKKVLSYMHAYTKANNILVKEGRFDLSNIQRLIIKDVFETSKWESEKFQTHDYRKFDYFNKKSFSKKEAIGKKYIWIAYNKWMSIILDNYLYNDYPTSSSKLGVYRGGWSPFLRDIDPTILIDESFNEKEYKRDELTFWSPTCTIESSQQSDEKWVKSYGDIINPKQIIEVEHNQNKWVNLSSMPSWNEVISEKDESKKAERDVWFHVKSYIINKKDKDKLIKALKGKSFWNHSIPQEQEIYELFSREYYWSEGYKETTYNEEARLLHSSFKGNVLKGIISTKQYTWYSDRDFSLKAHLYISRPNKVLFDLLDLTFKEDEHKFYDKKTGKLLLYNPALEFQKGFDALLVRKNELLDKLSAHNLDIIWCVLGAKEVIKSNRITHESHINNIFYFNEERELLGDFTLDEPRFNS